MPGNPKEAGFVCQLKELPLAPFVLFPEMLLL